MASAAPQAAPAAVPALGPALGAVQGQIATPGAFYAAGQTIQVQEVRLADYAAALYPDLRRGMVVIVQRPWQLRRPDLSLLAARIRARQAEIMGLEADQVIASHAMLYAGMGRCWSQGTEFAIEQLEAYRGCTLYFWDNPAWSLDDQLRHRLMSNCGPHAGARYAYGDIAGLLAWAVTGSEGWLERLGDKTHWYCSEAVCVLVRAVEARAGREFMPGEPAERVTPQVLHNYLLAQGWSCVALRIA